jgi:glutathione S-transferase
MPTIFGAFRSRATRPIWLMYEAGVDFTHVPVVQAYRPSAAGAAVTTTSGDFLAINPQAQVPAMQDGDLVLTESLAIALYLARKYGGDLGPRDLAEEGQAMQWALVGATAVETPALDIGYTYMQGTSETPESRALIAERLTTLARPFARIEAHLQGRDWLMGARFTVADICLAECVRYCMMEPGAYDPYPALKAWLARCHARPAFQKMWAARNAEAV